MLGGMVAQEIVKAITQKFMPIKQNFYFDCSELYPCSDIESLGEEGIREKLVSTEDFDASEDRYIGL